MSDQLLLRTRPTTVEARRVTADTRDEVIDWLKQDRTAWPYGTRGITWWQDGTLHDAFVGDWVIKTAWGEYQRISDSALFSRFESVVAGVSE